jgi:hypothetical protein
MQRLWPPMPATRRVLAAAAPRGASARLGAGGAARAGAARRCRARGSSAGHAQRGWRRRLRSATRPRARRGGETRRPRRGRTARRRSERRAAPRGRRRQRRNRCGCCDSRGRHAARPRREPQVRTSWRREREAIWRASALGCRTNRTKRRTMLQTFSALPVRCVLRLGCACVPRSCAAACRLAAAPARQRRRS